MKKSAGKKTILLFTLLYLLLMGLVFFLFRSQERSLVYPSDGWRQHLRALTYYGKYLRGALRHLIIEHSLAPQTWGVDFGYGADVISTLQYYCLGDPLAALAVFVPTAQTLALYEFLILFRPWLAGLAFCAYAFSRGERRPAPVLTGALVYTFSGTVLYIGFLHPYFVNPMIWFPLLLVGIERALTSGKGRAVHPWRRFVPFAVFVALAALCNFYFFYMLAIFAAAYGVARLFQLHGNAGARGKALVRAVLLDGAGLLMAALVGVLTAGVTLFPVLTQFRDNPRAGVSFARQLFYDRDYYTQLLKNLVSWINHPEMDTELCFALTFVPLALFLLFRKGHRTLKLCLALTVLLLLFPAGGVFLNGFSYMINRWTWAAAMLTGWICVCAVSDLASLLADREKTRTGVHPAALLPSIPALTAVLILWNIVYAFAPQYGAFPNEFLERMDSDTFLAAATENEVTAVAAVGGTDDHDFYRYSGRNLLWNAALASGLSSTQFAFSFANGVVSDYFQQLGINDEQNFAYFALDDRMPALSLAGVRYYTLAYDNYYEYRFVPYGFVDRGMVGSYRVYENPYALPLGFATSRVMARSEWEKLAPALREEALLSAAVVEDGQDGILPAGLTEAYALDIHTADDAALASASLELPFSVICGEGVTFLGDSFAVASGGGTATLLLSEPVPAGAELLVSLEGLWVDGNDSHYEPVFTAQANGEEWISKQIRYKSPASQYYSDWHNFLVNFGSACETVDAITIDFPAAGVCSFDRLTVVLRQMAHIPERLQALAEKRLQNLNLHENPISRATGEITGEIALADDAMLVLTLPYSAGFAARVDGVKTPLYKTDAMFLSLPLTAGTHDIRIVYRTPGLLPGALCSLVGVVLLILMGCWKGVRVRRTSA